MPAQRAAAAFEPISPALDLDALVEETSNFQYAVRISCDMIEVQGIEAFEKLVLLHVIIGGKPLVVEGFLQNLDQWTFSSQWLRDNFGKKYEQARNLTKHANLTLSIKHYLDNMALLTNQWTNSNFRDTTRQRLYLKDIDCPQLWHDKLRELIPTCLFYLNESTGETGGPGAVEEMNSSGIGTRLGRGIAKAGDLMSCLPPAMRAENLMCYIGHEGTYTPAHREMCASLGQNIMVEASGHLGDDGKPTKPGSSIWFMTESKDRHLVSEYWLSALGHDIEVESHFAQVNAWKRAPFTVYIVDQKPGDFILIPPLAPHQVWNRGTRTMKVAWNRTTVETLELALNEALPQARMVCRDEQYKNKAIVLFALNRYSGLLKQVEGYRYGGPQENLSKSHKIRQLQKDFKRLFTLFTQILISEMFSSIGAEKKCEYLPFDSNVTCSYCRCNIFNRFLTCKHCIVPLENGEEDTYDVCMECYIMGRSCRCRSRLTWVEQFPWKDLVEKYDLWREQITAFSVSPNIKAPLPLDILRKRWPTKTLAEICQEQLKIRPWKDHTKEDTPDPEEDDTEEEGAKEGGEKKKSKKKSAKWLKDSLPCHICCYRHSKWKMAICECGIAFCYGVLWRGFDLMPQTVMEDSSWKCPRCRKICTCKHCAKIPDIKPYEPKGTILGHDTKRFADPRSVESLVDFSYSNMHWLRKAGDNDQDQSRRMQKRYHEASEAKSREPALNEHYVDADGRAQTQLSDTNVQEASIPLDPLLVNNSTPANPENGFAEDDEMREAAAMALHAMDDLSQLEQDPARFIAQAGLDNIKPLEANGTEPISADGKNSNATHPRKRKRASDKALNQNDTSFPMHGANQKFHQQQAQKLIDQARKKGTLISAKAAFKGESKLVVFRLSPSSLAALPASTESQAPAIITSEPQEAAALVHSDLPKEPSPTATKTRRKRHRVELDEDFRTSKSGRTSRGKSQKQPSADQELNQSASESSSEINLEEFEVEAARPTKRRSLPAYLARRSPVESSDLPKELTGTSMGRKPRRSSSNAAPPGSLSNSAVVEKESGESSETPASLVRSERSQTPPSNFVRKPGSPTHQERSANPGRSPIANSHSAKANLKAKMLAMNNNSAEDSLSGSDDSLEDKTELQPEAKSKAKARLSAGESKRVAIRSSRSPRPTSTAKPSVSVGAAARSNPPVRASIFSKASRGKIRIASAWNVG